MFQQISQSKLISQIQESNFFKNISQLKVVDQFNKINQRERLILSSAGILLVLFMIVQWMIFPILDRHTQLQQKLIEAKQDLNEIALLKADYKRFTTQADLAKAQIQRRNKDFSLLSFLNDIAARTGLKNNIVNMKPSTSNRKSSSLQVESVEMKFDDVNIEQLLAFLYRVETSPNLINIRQISITKQDRKEGVVESILEVETFKL
jgi:general secretion pathway protein M